MPLYEDALGDWRNAQFLARASDLSYYPEGEAMPKFRDELGMQAHLISRGNTQAYILTNDEHIVVAFRGTEAPTSIEGLKDWLLTDAMNLLILPEGRLGTDLAAAGVGARFHQGFVNAIADIWEPVFEIVSAERKKADRPLWVTGHSLGGALALLFAWLCQRRFVGVHQVYTFGGPMIGNTEAIAAFDRELAGKIYRCVDPHDPVPELPAMSLVANRYSHCQRELGLGERPAGGYWSGLASQVVGDVLSGNGIDQVWAYINARIGAHSMTTYLDHVKKRLT